MLGAVGAANAVPDSARAMLAAQVFIRIILFLSFLEDYENPMAP
jgi:hypothetical protein